MNSVIAILQAQWEVYHNKGKETGDASLLIIADEIAAAIEILELNNHE